MKPSITFHENVVVNPFKQMEEERKGLFNIGDRLLSQNNISYYRYTGYPLWSTTKTGIARDTYPWKLNVGIIGNEEGCEIAEIVVTYELTKDLNAKFNDEIVGDLKQNGAITFVIPGKKYDREIKRLVFDDADLITNKTMKHATLLALGTMFGHLVATSEAENPIREMLAAIGVIINNSNMSLVGTMLDVTREFISNAKTLASIGIHPTNGLYITRLFLKLINDGRDIISRIYSRTEHFIRNCGYKFKSHANSISTKTIVDSSAWFDEYDPNKTKAYRELNLVTTQKRGKGISPYPSFHKNDLIGCCLNGTLDAQNFLYSDTVKKYYVNREKLDEFEKIKGKVDEAMKQKSKDGYDQISFKRLYSLMEAHFLFINALKTVNSTTKFVEWITSRDIQLPIIVLTNSDMYCIKAVNNPKFVPLGYRSVLSLEGLILMDVNDSTITEDNIKSVPQSYYESIYKLRKSHTLDVRDKATQLIRHLIEEAELKMPAFTNRVMYNEDKPLPNLDRYEGESLTYMRGNRGLPKNEEMKKEEKQNNSSGTNGTLVTRAQSGAMSKYSTN